MSTAENYFKTKSLHCDENKKVEPSSD